MNSLFGGDLFGFSSFHGYVGDARALSEAEISNIQIAQMQSMQQAEWPLSYLRGQAQYQPPDPRPLDERFADFKRRLADALDRFNQIKANQVGL